MLKEPAESSAVSVDWGTGIGPSAVAISHAGGRHQYICADTIPIGIQPRPPARQDEARARRMNGYLDNGYLIRTSLYRTDW